jgi:predicted SnoaL-like aldol condensation-catalyzing enzyme
VRVEWTGICPASGVDERTIRGMDPKGVVIAWQRGQRSDGRAANEKYLADDIKLVLPGKNPIVGKEACSEHFARVEDSFLPLRVSTVDGPYTVIISEGNLVAHRFRWFGETHDGQLVDLFIFNLYRVNDGKIDYFEEHYDTLTRARYSYGYEVNAEDRVFDPETRIIASQ